jgi:hypothetical protein
MFDHLPTLAEGWEMEKARHSANRAMRKTFGKLQGIKLGRQGERERENEYRASMSFGPVFTDAQLGSKVSMV